MIAQAQRRVRGTEAESCATTVTCRGAGGLLVSAGYSPYPRPLNERPWGRAGRGPPRRIPQFSLATRGRPACRHRQIILSDDSWSRTIQEGFRMDTSRMERPWRGHSGRGLRVKRGNWGRMPSCVVQIVQLRPLDASQVIAIPRLSLNSASFATRRSPV